MTTPLLEVRTSSGLIATDLIWVRRGSFEQGCLQALVILLKVADPCQPILLLAQDLGLFLAQLADVQKGGKHTIETLLDIPAQLYPNFTNQIQFLLQAIAAVLLLP